LKKIKFLDANVKIIKLAKSCEMHLAHFTLLWANDLVVAFTVTKAKPTAKVRVTSMSLLFAVAKRNSLPKKCASVC